MFTADVRVQVPPRPPKWSKRNACSIFCMLKKRRRETKRKGPERIGSRPCLAFGRRIPGRNSVTGHSVWITGKARSTTAPGPAWWRRRWDSNPRALADNLISSQARCDHFDTSPAERIGVQMTQSQLLYQQRRKKSSCFREKSFLQQNRLNLSPGHGFVQRLRDLLKIRH